MNPFVFPKSKHVRTEKPGELSSYQQFKPFLQREFERKCVYCRKPDTSGSDSFGVDHYRPKSRFPQLITTYSNLFYCCNACNRRKGSHWASGKFAKQQFVPNPCDHEMFRHLRYKRARIESTSDAGEFSIELLDLNDPESISFRDAVLHAIDALEMQKSDLRKVSGKLKAVQKTNKMSNADAISDITKIDAEIARIDQSLATLCGSA